MTDYITDVDLRKYLGSDTSNFSTVVSAACTVASRAVEAMCGRTFNAESSTTTLYLDPENRYEVCFGIDVYTTSSLVLSIDDGSGTYPTSWTLDNQFLLEPRNQRYGSITGYPWTAARAIRGNWFPPSQYGFESVKLVAKPGWAAVPAEVPLAALEIAAMLYKAKDAADGFVGLDGWGPARLRAEFPMAAKILAPLMLSPISVA